MRELAMLAIAVGISLGPACAAVPPAVAGTAAAGVAAAGEHTLTGTFRWHRLHSAFLPDDRQVAVYLPPGYDADRTRTYPVLYMQDGNNVFDSATAFLGREWRVDETVQALILQKRLPGLIVVGVYNTPERIFEYTWVSGGEGQPRSGGGERYGRLLADEVKPLIDRTYRTRPGRADTAVMGSSLGGLESFYLGRYQGDVFGKVGLMSPSIWWAGRVVLSEVPALRRDLTIWLDMGTQEGESPTYARENLANARKLRDALVARGYRLGADLGYFEDEGGTHDEPTWARRVERPLGFFFAP